MTERQRQAAKERHRREAETEAGMAGMSSRKIEYVYVAPSPFPVIATALVTGVLGFVAGQFLRLPWVSGVCENPVGMLGICAAICIALCAVQTFWLSQTSNWLLWLNRELSANRSTSTESEGESG